MTPMTEPNGICTADFKGQFKTRDGVYCYPLTLVDGFSRYLLACQGRRSAIAYRPAHRTSRTQRDVRAVVGIRELLVRTRTRWIVHIRTLLRRDGLRLAPGRAELFGTRVNDVPLSPELAARIAPVLALLAPLNVQIAGLDSQVSRCAREDERTRRLMTVLGVGPVTVVVFVATIDQVARFRNAHQLER